MSIETLEVAVLESIVPQLEAEGFDVYTHPTRHILPPFMGDQSPDAIALRHDKKLAIEIVGEGPSSKARLEKLRNVFSGHRDWELRVYWARPATIPQPIEGASRETIEQSIRGVEELAAEGRTGPALLMAWATFEALGRALLPEKFVRPQTPERLVEVLAAEGHVTPGEADLLRRLGKGRNQPIHGGFHLPVAEPDIRRFVEVLGTLLDLLRKDEP